MRVGKDVDPAALRRFREVRGLTQEELAELVWASPLEVAAWEAGSVRVPREQARRLRQLDTASRRDAALAAAGLPACAWADAHVPGLHAMLLDHPDVPDRLSTQVQVHLDACPTCNRVREFGRGLVRVRPGPGLGTDPIESLEYWFDATPRWVLYAVLIGGGTALVAGGGLLLDDLPALPAESVWMDGARVVLWGGVAFGAAATVLRRLVRRSPYLAGTLSGAAAVLVGMAVWVLSAPGERWFSGPALLALLLLAGTVGVLAGRWNGRNPWGDAPDAETVQGETDPGWLVAPDPLREVNAADASVGVPLPAAAPRSARQA